MKKSFIVLILLSLFALPSFAYEINIDERSQNFLDKYCGNKIVSLLPEKLFSTAPLKEETLETTELFIWGAKGYILKELNQLEIIIAGGAFIGGNTTGGRRFDYISTIYLVKENCQVKNFKVNIQSGGTLE